MQILVTGSLGQLGRDCRAVLGERHEVTCLSHAQLDITHRDAVFKVIKDLSPDAVVNCAAYNDVDEAENRPELAFAVNAKAPGYLAEACATCQARFLHVSTDYVFDGLKPVPRAYTEADPPAPINAYGRSKLAGEDAVWNSGARAAVLRTAWLYGAHGNNFPRRMLAHATRFPDKPLRIADDQYGNPTWSGRLARQIARLLEDFRTGLFHAAAETGASRYELTQCFLRALGLKCTIEPCGSDCFPSPAPRPANTMLENRALSQAGLCVMRPWDQDIKEFAEHVRHAWTRNTIP